MKRLTVLTAAFLAVSAVPAFAAISDQEFVTKASIDGNYAFQSALFATTASPDARVKAYADKSVADLTDLNARLNAIAALDRLNLPYAVDSRHDAMLKQLEVAKLRSDAQAQQLYVSQQKQTRDETIALYERYVAEGTNARLKDYAQAALQTLRAQQKAIAPLVR